MTTDSTVTRPTETATAENVEQPHEEDQSQFLSSSISSLFNTDLNVSVSVFVCVDKPCLCVFI